MASEYTENRRYPLYVATDKPNLRDQYNGAIREIDKDMAQALADSSGVAAALGAGFDAQHTVRMAVDAANTSITNEATARANADTAINDKIGTGFSSSSTVRQQIDAKASTQQLSDEATARANADTAINDKIGTGFSSSNTVRQQIDAKASTQQLSAESTARANADDALDARLDALETTKYMVVIGDSFSVESAADTPMIWPKLVSRVLGLEVKNYAVGSTGFCLGGANIFSQQLVRATSEISDHNRVDKVFIFGGINDVNEITIAPMDVYNAAFDLIRNAASTFTKADIVVIGVCPARNADRTGNGTAPFRNGEYCHRTDTFTEHLALACANCNTQTESVMSAVKFISLRNFSYFIDGFFRSTSNWHPSKAGHMALASKILGGDVVHDTANVGNTALTAKPTYIDKDGVEHQPSYTDITITGPHTANILVMFDTAPKGTGSAQNQIKLNGYPSGPAYMNIVGVNTHLVYQCHGLGTPIGRSYYNVPGSYNDTAFRMSYTIGI